MSLNITREVADMKKLTTGELKDKYETVCGCAPRSHNRDWLVKKIVWRMQAIDEGGLPERARRRALEMADDADLRKRPPRSFTQQVEAAEETTVAPDPGPRHTLTAVRNGAGENVQGPDDHGHRQPR